ncbi:hypothetical protein [Fonticella tunisiensis]|uniref:Uncharacterized protein n=1 Tax=Fonticella tunisiensis TaxID=1096341 RepID=A0A4R7KBF4_9CLOT|nr:hypothetical protein [Fonticella tunisiensis]TDT50947.1 hypothetical protein EDD71_12343 [Fonticella tunisiensis]
MEGCEKNVKSLEFFDAAASDGISYGRIGKLNIRLQIIFFD